MRKKVFVGAVFVVLDSLQKVLPRSKSRSSNASYEESYDWLGPVKLLAEQHDVAILIVHHTNKAQHDDVRFVSFRQLIQQACEASFALLTKQAPKERSHAQQRDVGLDVTALRIEQMQMLRRENNSKSTRTRFTQIRSSCRRNSPPSTRSAPAPITAA